MNGSNGRQSSLYEQTLEHARREIDEASAQITRLREHLSYLEARMEAAKSVYEAVAARLNIEDESIEASQEEVVDTRHAPPSPVVSREEIARLLHPQESSLREAPPPASPPPREPAGLSTSERDLIRQHLEARGSRNAGPEPAPVAPPPKQGPGGGLSDEDRRLIEEHLRRRVDAERQSA